MVTSGCVKAECFMLSEANHIDRQQFEKAMSLQSRRCLRRIGREKGRFIFG